MITLTLPRFTHGLPADQVHASLRQALDVCDRAQESAVLWFAEVQRRGLHRQLGHASLQLYATVGLGCSDNRYWLFKRLADDLDRLPALREAVASGEVGWTKARQVARVATVETQAEWVARAATTGRRALEQQVREARKPAAQRPLVDAPSRPVADPSVADPSVADPSVADLPVTISLRADGVQLARFEALVEKAHKLGLAPAGGDRLDLMLAALETLIETQAGERGTRGSAVQIIVQQCPDCAAATAVANRGERRLAPAQVEALACDAKVRKPGRLNRATIKPAVRAAVLSRDRHRCTTPGCRSAHFLEVHHVTPRAQGGSNHADNLVTLCNRCHGFAHEWAGRLAPAQVGIEEVGSR